MTKSQLEIKKIMKQLRFFVLMLGLLQISGCHWLSAARYITEQGNVISEKQLGQLKLGMNKNEAAIILGNTLITPTFNHNRWDYSMTWQRGEGKLLIKRVSLFFEKNKLREIKTQPFS